MASAATKSTKTAEFLGVVSFALSLMVLISVATYNPGDPVPFFKAGKELRDRVNRGKTPRGAPRLERVSA